jgi:hypothetical protein
MRQSLSVTSAFVGTLLAGCALPLPHREYLAPSVSGVLRSAGKPIVGATVKYAYWAEEPECSHSDATTLTGDDGSFAFSDGREFRFLVVFGDPIYHYEICAEVADQVLLLWSNWDSLDLDTPAELSCDVDAPVQGDQASRGRCEVRWPTHQD